MAKPSLFLPLLALAAFGPGACAPVKDYHGYIADEVTPAMLEPGTDTRTTVLAKLGSPSTTGMFMPGEPITPALSDDPVWIYVTYVQGRLAYLRPKEIERTVTAIRFDAEDRVESVEVKDLADGQRLAYASRETPTRGRELGILEQIFGSVGRVALPAETNPGDPTGRN
jgi:outer membrane protein assembly factor BamE (lipoprotein component of BamABCDE complex)